jgi:hypothetical protein
MESETVMHETPWQFIKRRFERCAMVVRETCPKCGRKAECDPTHWRGWVENVKIEEPCTWEDVLDQNLQEYEGWLRNQTLTNQETKKILQTSAINSAEA